MKYGSIVMAIVFFIGLSPTARSQSVQTNGLRDRQIAHLPIMGTNVPYGLSREFLGAPSNHRLPTGFMTRIDSLRMKGLSYLLSNDKFIPDGRRKASNRALAKLSPQSQISVIDTAIVRSTVDTTRHLYSFNAKAKRTSDLTQRLKGELWVDPWRETNTYDASNNMLSELYEYWSNGQWVNVRRNTYTYDANGRQTSILSESWSNGQWVNVRRNTYTYDANNNMLLDLFESYVNSQWMNERRHTYTYDTNGNMLSGLHGEYTNGQLMIGWRDTWTYDANGRETSVLDEEWSNGQWLNGYRSTSSYDADGNLLSVLYEYWSTGSWANGERYTYTYDANKNMLSELYESWSNGQWLNGWRETWTYDANRNMLSDVYESWSNGQLMIGWRDTWTYDANGRETSELDEQRSNGQLVNYSLDTYSYDAQENLTSVWFYTWLNSSWTPTDRGAAEIGGLRIADSAGNRYDFSLGHNYTFTRRLIVTGVASESGGGPASYSLSQNYPNPFNPTTVVSYQIPAASNIRLVVYDLIGREVSVLVNERREAGVHEVKFDGSGLSSGVYFYRLQANDFVQTRKLLLIR